LDDEGREVQMDRPGGRGADGAAGWSPFFVGVRMKRSMPPDMTSVMWVWISCC